MSKRQDKTEAMARAIQRADDVADKLPKIYDRALTAVTELRRQGFRIVRIPESQRDD